MKPRHVTVRGRKTSKRSGDKVGYGKDLALTFSLLASLIGVALFALYFFQSIQRETYDLREDHGKKLAAIEQLETEITNLKIETGKLQSMAHIDRKIKEFKLALRPTDPSQIRMMAVRRGSVYQGDGTITASRPKNK